MKMTWDGLVAHYAAATRRCLPEQHAYIKLATKVYYGEVRKLFGDRYKLKALAPDTIAGRIRKARLRRGNIMGQTAPLVDTGKLRSSVKWAVDGLHGVVGSDSPLMAYHELGTAHIPPRPVFRIALGVVDPIVHVMAERTVKLIIRRGP